MVIQLKSELFAKSVIYLIRKKGEIINYDEVYKKMTFGQKIKKLRIEANLTQKDVAEKMNVSFQTVSKWESDLNEPDIYNIKELAKIFNCSVEYLFSDDEDKTIASKDEEKPIETIEKEVDSEVIVLPKKIGNCADCNKELFDGDLIHNVERKSNSGVKEMVTVCDSCFKKHEEEIRKRTAEVYKQTKEIKGASKVREDSKVLTWSIVIAIIGFVGVLIAAIINYSTIGIGWTIGLPILAAYILLADIYCIFTGSWISDVFLSVASWSIRFPGIIFSFDLDGLMFLIVMKILFWILGVAIGIGVFLLALFLSSIFSFICFPFLFIYNRCK